MCWSTFAIGAMFTHTAQFQDADSASRLVVTEPDGSCMHKFGHIIFQNDIVDVFSGQKCLLKIVLEAFQNNANE